MNAKVENDEFRFDALKWLVVVALVIGVAVANSYFASEFALLYRVLAIVGVFAVAGFVAANTSKGHAFVELLRSSVTEVRKVVWPTRQETIQTTFLVVVVVFIAALILWGLDTLFGYLASLVIG